MKEFRRNAARTTLILVATSFLSGRSPVLAQTTMSGPEREEAYKKMEVLAEALLTVKRYYVEEKTYEELIDGALRGMLSSLDDHSGYLAKAEFDAMKEDTDARFEGIGVRLELREGMLTVVTPMEGTPAFRAGLHSGDRIVTIDGRKVSDMDGGEPFDSLRGPKGEKVVIEIESDEDEAPREVVIVRDDISVPTVKGAEMIADGVGYVRITQFSRPTPKALDKALDKLKKEKMESLVLDLRDNPGGLLTSAVDVCQKFVNRGDVILRVKGRKDEQESIKAKRGNPYRELRMAVLVNEGSASAAEIVAGALRDLDRAVLLGAPTYGKASVQSLIPMEKEKGAGLRLTTAHYCTPKGSAIHGVGLKPDIELKVSKLLWHKIRIKRAHTENPDYLKDVDWTEYDDVVDIVLEHAVAVLRSQTTDHRPQTTDGGGQKPEAGEEKEGPADHAD